MFIGDNENDVDGGGVLGGGEWLLFFKINDKFSLLCTAAGGLSIDNGEDVCGGGDKTLGKGVADVGVGFIIISDVSMSSVSDSRSALVICWFTDFLCLDSLLFCRRIPKPKWLSL